MKTGRSRVTSKGQITIPKQVREAMGISEGDRILFTIDSPYEARLVVDKRPGGSGGMMGHLARDGSAPSVAQIDSAAKQAATEKYKRKAGIH